MTRVDTTSTRDGFNFERIGLVDIKFQGASFVKTGKNKILVTNHKCAYLLLIQGTVMSLQTMPPMFTSRTGHRLVCTPSQEVYALGG